jgi:hypothetical protein
MTEVQMPQPGGFLLYDTEDGRTRVECRFVAETLWLPQSGMAELFQTSKQNIAKHLKAIFAEGELAPDSVVNQWLTTAADGRMCCSRRSSTTWKLRWQHFAMWRRACRRRCRKHDVTALLLPRSGEKERHWVAGLRGMSRRRGCVATCIAPTKARASRLASLPHSDGSQLSFSPRDARGEGTTLGFPERLSWR